MHPSPLRHMCSFNVMPCLAHHMLDIMPYTQYSLQCLPQLLSSRAYDCLVAKLRFKRSLIDEVLRMTNL